MIEWPVERPLSLSRDPVYGDHVTILYRTATGLEHVHVSTTTISVVMGLGRTKQVTHTGPV